MTTRSLLLCLLPGVLVACGADEDGPQGAFPSTGWLPPPTGPQASLHLAAKDQAPRLEADLAGLRLRLLWADSERVSLDLGLLRLGRVKSYDPEWNCDPVFYADDPPPGLVWYRVKAASFVPHLRGPLLAQPGVKQVPDLGGLTVRLELVDEAAQPGPPWQLVLRPLDRGILRADLEPAEEAERLAAASPEQAKKPAWVYTRLVAVVGKAQSLWGMGETLDGPEHRGRLRAMQIEADLSSEGGYNEVHVPVPLVIGSRGWGLLVESRRPAVFDLAKAHPERVEAFFHAAGLRFWLLVAGHPLEVTGLYTRITGAPALPAQWAFAPLIWRNENKDDAEVIDDMEKIRQHDLAIGGMWIDRPYDTHVNNFEFDPARFKDPEAMIARVHALGMRMGLWSTPYVEEGAKEHDKVEQSGWFVGVPKVAQGFLKWGPPLDFTNPEVPPFWKHEIGKMRARGIEGWKLDFAEDIHVGLFSLRLNYSFHDGSDERTMHHGYAPIYHRPYAETLPPEGGFLLCRAGTYGDQVYSSVIWPGDLCAGFWKHGECDSAGTCHVGGLPASYSAMLGLAVSGYPLYGADTGGYRHERPTREVMLRWGAQTAFSAFMQIGGGSQNNPWDFKKYGPSQFDQALLDAFVVLTRLHTRLFPYLYTLARQAHEHGLGPVRPFGLAHPELAAVPLYAEVSVTQHWLGPDLLVAPILGPESKRRVLLPPGSFYDFWSHTLVAGPAGRVPSEPLALEVEVPLGRIPVYVRAGALVPLLRPTIDTLAPASEPGVDSFANETGRLHVLVAPGAGGAFELYDGSALEMAALGSGHRLDFAAGKVFTQGLELEIWDAKTEPAAVRVNGKPVAVGEAAPLPAAWRAEGVLHVRVDGKAIRVEW